MDLADLEALATALYAELGIDPERPPRAERLARAWLDNRNAVVRRSLVATPSARQRLHGVVTIVVRPSVPDEYLPFFVCHELAHEILERAGYVGEDVEAACDYLGAALILPRQCVVAVYRADGFAPRALAEICGGTETLGALRIPEVLRMPAVIVSPRDVRPRGDEDFVWGDEPAIRRLAARAKLGPGLSAVRIGDQKGRKAIVADVDEIRANDRDVG